jgi:hypothetical protein
MSNRAHEVIAMAYHTVGAINEKLAMTAYRRMAAVAEEIGEHDLAVVLFNPMRRDESLHLSYYRTYARELGRTLHPWQLTAARWLVVNTYAPVGARRARHKSSLGRTMMALEEDPDCSTIAELCQTIAAELLSTGGRSLPPFVRTTMAECLAVTRAEEPGALPTPHLPAA